jgi:hypothetical protein
LINAEFLSCTRYLVSGLAILNNEQIILIILGVTREPSLPAKMAPALEGDASEWSPENLEGSLSMLTSVVAELQHTA